MKQIKIAESDDEIKMCFPVMKELRPHFISEKDFLSQVKDQMKNHDFNLIFIASEEVKAVAGIRIAQWLATGKYLEIEDLVTKKGERSKNYGGKLFDWIAEYARRQNCTHLKLVSAVQRFGAHKFYLNKGMILQAHYFSREL